MDTARVTVILDLVADEGRMPETGRLSRDIEHALSGLRLGSVVSPPFRAMVTAVEGPGAAVQWDGDRP